MENLYSDDGKDKSMNLGDYYFREVPDYYPTMYQDGYTPE